MDDIPKDITRETKKHQSPEKGWQMGQVFQVSGITRVGGLFYGYKKQLKGTYKRIAQQQHESTNHKHGVGHSIVKVEYSPHARYKT